MLTSRARQLTGTLRGRVLGLVALLTSLTIARNRVWYDEVSL